MRFATIALFLLTAACVPPLPGGTLDTGAGRGGTVGPGGPGGRSGGSPGAGAIGGSAVGAGGSSSMPVPTARRRTLGVWPGPGETTGSAGTSGADAGTAPTCGAPRCTPQPGCINPPPVISPASDLESACSDIAPVDGRDGVWLVYATGSSIVDPSPNQPFRVACDGAQPEAVTRAAQFRGSLSGSGYPTAGIGFTPIKDYKAYDASRYRGVAFFLYVDSVPPSASFRFQVPLVADQDPAHGGSCTSDCFNSFQFLLPLKASGWMRYEIQFPQLARQPGWGTPETWIR